MFVTYSALRSNHACSLHTLQNYCSTFDHFKFTLLLEATHPSMHCLKHSDVKAPINTPSHKTLHSRFGLETKRVSYVSNHLSNSNNYYYRQPNKKTDYKVFHKIPSSSILLTTYDPFYSPLLSRLDAVFQQLGLGDGKTPGTEPCRERLVCLMYANPAKYAPYSNLVSAQLSRWVNDVRVVAGGGCRSVCVCVCVFACCD